jgi:hypothetical protein
MARFKVQSWHLPRESRKNVGRFGMMVKKSISINPGIQLRSETGVQTLTTVNRAPLLNGRVCSVGGMTVTGNGKGKGKGHPRTGHEGPDGK